MTGNNHLYTIVYRAEARLKVAQQELAFFRTQEMDNEPLRPHQRVKLHVLTDAVQQCERDVAWARHKLAQDQ